MPHIQSEFTAGAHGDGPHGERGVPYGRGDGPDGGSSDHPVPSAVAVCCDYSGAAAAATADGNNYEHVSAGQRGADRLGGDRGRDPELHRGKGSHAGALPHCLLRPPSLLQGRTVWLNFL